MTVNETDNEQWHYLTGGANRHTLTARDGNNVLTAGSGYTTIELDVAKISGGFKFDGNDPTRWKQNADGAWQQGVGREFEYQRVWRDIDGNGKEDAGDEYDYFTASQAIRIFGSDGDDTMIGGNGTNLFYGNGGNDKLIGGSGEDYLYGGSGNNHIIGGAGDDYLVTYIDLSNPSAPDGNNYVDAGTGNDMIYAGYGNDELRSGDGDDFIEDLGGRNRIHAGAGDDYVFAGSGNDKIFGGSGYDDMMGGGGDDFMSGGHGNDLINGESGKDVLSGRQGNDELYGGADNDVLRGGSGDDTLYGGSGDDRLSGHKGNDKLTGGAGDDVFNLSLRRAEETDVITDFTSGEDVIRVRRYEGDIYWQQKDGAVHLSTEVGKTAFAVLRNISSVQDSDFVRSDITLISVADLEDDSAIGNVLDIV